MAADVYKSHGISTGVHQKTPRKPPKP